MRGRGRMPIMIQSFNPTRALVLILTLLALPLAVAACSWQVPADPGLNYQQRVRTPAVASTPTAPAAARTQVPRLAGSFDRADGRRAISHAHCLSAAEADRRWIKPSAPNSLYSCARFATHDFC
jgi:hypothetical protein